MSSTFTRSGSISYTSIATGYGAGTLQVVNWNDYSAKAEAIQAVRAAGGEVIQYLEPPRWTGGLAGIGKLLYAPGGVYTIAAAAAAGWLFDNANPTRIVNPGYSGPAMGLKGSAGPTGTPWMRQIVQWCCDRMNDPAWKLDGFMLDSTGNGSMDGAFNGWASQAERDDFNEGACVLASMLRAACGPDVIFVANNFFINKGTGLTAAAKVNGILNEKHNDAPVSGSWLLTDYSFCTNPKRRVMFIPAGSRPNSGPASTTGGHAEASASIGTPVTHVCVDQTGDSTGGSYVVGAAPGTVSGIGNGAWPADALHIQGWNSINAGASPSGATGVPTNPNPGGGTPTVTISPNSASVQVGTTIQYTGYSSDGSAISWTVNGVPGGNSTVGTVSSSGLYTAPASVPSPSQVAVRATNATGQFAEGSLSVTTTPQTTPDKPAVPTGMAVAVGNGSLTVTWNPVTANPAVDSYQVYVNDLNTGFSNLDVGLGTTYTITGLTNGTPYSVRVSAHNSVDYGDWCAAITQTPSGSAAPPPADTTPPQAPTSTYLVGVEGLNVTIAYGLLPTTDPAERQTTYIIRKAGSTFAAGDLPGSPGITTVATLSPGVTGQTVETVPGAGTYFYRLVLRDAAGNTTLGPTASATVATSSFTPATHFAGSFAGAALDPPDVALWRDPTITRSGVTGGSSVALDGAGLLVLSATAAAVGTFGRLGTELRVPLNLASQSGARWLRVPVYHSGPGTGSASSRVLLCGTAGLADPNQSGELIRFKQVGTSLLVERRTGGGALATLATLAAPTGTLYNLDLLLTATTVRAKVNDADVDLGAGVGVAVAHGASLPSAVLYLEAGNDSASAVTAKYGAVTFERSTPSTPTGVRTSVSGGVVTYDCNPAPDEDGVTSYEVAIQGLGVQASGASLPLTASAPAARATPYVVELITINASPF